jgi:hypothetical protein
LTARTVLASRDVGTVTRPYPGDLADVWKAGKLGPVVAAQRYASAGDILASALFTPETQAVLAGMVDQLIPGNRVEFVLHAAGAALTLPWELLRLAGEPGTATGPVCLRAGVSMRRHVDGAPLTSPVQLPGPLKVLAAVAAPDETKTDNTPLDVEAQMQAVLDATTALASPRTGPGTNPAAGTNPASGTGTDLGSNGPATVRGQVQILEVASAEQIAAALHADGYHVSALVRPRVGQQCRVGRRSGNPESTSAADLVEALRRAAAPSRSSCSPPVRRRRRSWRHRHGLRPGLGRADRVIAFKPGHRGLRHPPGPTTSAPTCSPTSHRHARPLRQATPNGSGRGVGGRRSGAWPPAVRG